MAVVYRCVGILTVDVVFFRSPGVFHSQDSFPSTFRPRLWETSSGVVGVGVFAAVAPRDNGQERSGPPLWSRDNIVTSHAAGPGSIPGRISFLVVFSGGFPQP